MNEIMMVVLEGLLSICIVLMMRYVIPYMKFWLQSKVDANVWDAVITAVKSVEQDAKLILGSSKKNEVIARVTKWANDNGINITHEQLSELVEAAVWVMKHEDKKEG